MRRISFLECGDLAPLFFRAARRAGNPGRPKSMPPCCPSRTEEKRRQVAALQKRDATLS